MSSRSARAAAAATVIRKDDSEKKLAYAQQISNARENEIEREKRMVFFKQIVYENSMFVWPQICLKAPELISALVTTPYESLPPFTDAEIATRNIHPLVIHVHHDDTIDVALSYQAKGFNVAAVNNANGDHPGGSYLDGNLFPQEENLIARSLLGVSLYNYGHTHSHELYPIADSGVIVTANATVFRNSKFELVPQADWKKLTFLSSAALDVRDLVDKYEMEQAKLIGEYICGIESNKKNNKGKNKNKNKNNNNNNNNKPQDPLEGDVLIMHLYDVDAQDYMIKLIRNILRAAILHDVDCPILGALGCGIFANPPKIVARLFRQTLEEREFKGAFRCVVFAITNGLGKPSPNYKVFKEELDPEPIA